MKTNLTKFGYIIIFYSIALLLKHYVVNVNPNIAQSGYFIMSVLYGLGPLIGGLVLIKGFKRTTNLSLFKAGKYQTILALLIPIILFTSTGLLNDKLDFFALKIVLISILYAIFEEYGWRGYLQTELQGINRFLKYTIISVLWLGWHLEYDYTIYGFIITTIGSFGMGYVADKSKSLIYVSLFHALLNILLSAELAYIPFNQKVAIVCISALSIIYFMKFYKKRLVKNS